MIKNGHVKVYGKCHNLFQVTVPAKKIRKSSFKIAGLHANIQSENPLNTK